MDSSDQVEDFPVDNLIEELNNFVESCSKNEGCSKDCAQSRCNEGIVCSPYMKQTTQDEIELYSSQSMKNKRKSGIPVKNTKQKIEFELNNERCIENTEANLKRKIEIIGDEESPLIIDENKKKRKSSMIQMGDIPDEVLNVIIRSGIDDQLENVAMKEKLTDTIVKNIIKQVVTNRSVLAMIKKDIYGIDINDPDIETFEPKLTRAKTKELIEKQIINPEGVNHCGNSFISSLIGEPLNSSSIMSETSALVTTEFTEDEEDEEYHPEPDLDDLAGSDEESLASSYGSPSQSCMKMLSHSSSIITPSKDSLSSTTPSLLKKNILNQHKLAQRRLKFSHDDSLICSRTRSKCPLTDTPLEHLEMAFEPPDITADMYDTEVDDEEWGKFLLDLSKPTDAAKHAEDDERIDPEYNLMADTDEKSPSLDELREEFRGDRGVRISRREVHELVTDSFSSLESEEEDQEEEEHRQKHSNIDNSNNLSALPDTDLEKSILNITPFNAGNTPRLSNSQQPEIQELNEIESSCVTLKLARDQLEIVEYQLVQHTQLLLQSVLMCCYEEKFNYIEDGCIQMLKEIENVNEKTYDGKRMEVCNVFAAQTTIQQYNERREEFCLYKRDRENRKLENCGIRSLDNNYALSFPPLLRSILAESSALPFLDLLPRRIFNPFIQTKNSTRRKGFCISEYYLLAMSFKEIVPDIKIFCQESRKKNAKYFDSNLAQICDKVAEITKVATTSTVLSDHFCRLLKQNLYKERFEDNPLIKYTKTGIVELPEIDLSQKDVLLKENLRPLKDFDLQRFPSHFHNIIKMFCKSSEEQHISKPRIEQYFSGVLNGRRVIAIEKENKKNYKK